MLSKLQKRFIECYRKTPDPLTAYLAAGYKKSPDAEKRAVALARRAEASAPIVTPVTPEVDAVIQELRLLAFSNVKDYVRWDDKHGVVFVKSSDEISRAEAVGIMEVSSIPQKDGTYLTKIKLHPKQPAIDLLYKYLKEITTPDQLSQMTAVQVNMILSDPVSRRAIEHLSSQLYGNVDLKGENQNYYKTIKNAVRRTLAAGPGEAAGEV